jgi:solute carrier family 25 (mitochondrial phosphate transporter), member 23/24/25/41
MVLLPDINGSNESFSEFLVRSQRTMAAGGIAGCVAKTIMAPLSRLTILFQVGPMLSAVNKNGVVAVNNEFSGSLYSVGKRVFKEEGFLSFWKGNLTSVIHRFPYSAINFTVYDRLRTSFRNLNYRESPFTRFICGASAGGTACFACYPLDLVRTRLTVLKTPGNSSIYGSISSTMLSIMKNEGFLGLYRGVFVSVCVTTPTFGISFCVYGTVKEKLLKINSSYNIFKDSSEKLSAYGSMLCGAMSGITSSLIMFPADSLRRRMQVAGFLLNNSAGNNCASINTNTTSSKPCSSSSSSSSSVGDSSSLTRNESVTKPQRFCINSELFKVLKGDGYRGLYRGIVPEILKVTPMVSITFCVYEFTYDLLNP